MTLPAGLPQPPAPFADTLPALRWAGAYGAACLLWVLAVGPLGGPRWVAVHLFTLGVLTNLILGFSHHFARTLTRVPGGGARWWFWVVNLGVVTMLVGLPVGWVPALGAGATLLVAVVTAAWWRLRRLRHQAVGAPLTWVVRLYERAHGAFVHGAVLGALLGVGVLPGRWYGGVRLAHLHATVLGWAGLTLLATLVFLGPTIAATRVQQGAGATAARSLRHGASLLSLAVLLLVAVGLPAPWGTAARVGAGVCLAGFAVAATRVCWPVWIAVRGGASTPARPVVLVVLPVLVAAVWLDAGVVAAGSWRWLDALGLLLLTGVLAAAIMATLLHLAPILRGGTPERRRHLTGRLLIGARTRAVSLAGAVVLLTGAAAPLGIAWPPSAVGWLLLTATVLVTAATILWPLPAAVASPEVTRSADRSTRG